KPAECTGAAPGLNDGKQPRNQVGAIVLVQVVVEIVAEPGVVPGGESGGYEAGVADVEDGFAMRDLRGQHAPRVVGGYLQFRNEQDEFEVRIDLEPERVAARARQHEPAERGGPGIVRVAFDFAAQREQA